MDIKLQFGGEIDSKVDLRIISAYNRENKETNKTDLSLSHWDKSLIAQAKEIKSFEFFNANKAETYYFNSESGLSVLAYGMGLKGKTKAEDMRKAAANIYKAISKTSKIVHIDLDSFTSEAKLELNVNSFWEFLLMTAYSFEKYKSKKASVVLSNVTFFSNFKKKKVKALKVLEQAKMMIESVNISRDFINEPPNTLTSETFAKLVEKDAKKLPNVKVKVLNKAEIKKEKMGLFLSVNNGSAYEPRLVHLTYTPKKVTKNTKHIALVGKGLTFDSGGYSLKPAASMANMKFDMGGAATVYGAFRAAALLGSKIKMSCFLGMTDNMVNSLATAPDTIVTARNGKSVEILNTDAEGRLVLADVLDYACDHEPDQIIDAATLTGAVLVALGHETCGVMGNNQKLIDSILKVGKQTNEYFWQLPIIPEFREEIKSNIADLKNIGASRFGGSSKAGAFLEEFVKNDIPWAHLDIAGIGDSQGHLPYCPSKGASGLVVRSVANYLLNS